VKLNVQAPKGARQKYSCIRGFIRAFVAKKAASTEGAQQLFVPISERQRRIRAFAAKRKMLSCFSCFSW